jgi:hypothetical protein
MASSNLVAVIDKLTTLSTQLKPVVLAVTLEANAQNPFQVSIRPKTASTRQNANRIFQAHDRRIPGHSERRKQYEPRPGYLKTIRRYGCVESQ